MRHPQLSLLFACTLSFLLLAIPAREVRAGGYCGDGILGKGEQCDFGQAKYGQSDAACTKQCKLANNKKPACGDGILEKGEACDLGPNNGNFDWCYPGCFSTGGRGCTAKCQVAKGYRCGPNNSGCSQNCGDGYIEAGEKCDLGSEGQGVQHNGTGQGCTASCTVQTGWKCGPKPTAYPTTVCLHICGNGLVEPEKGEQCDDANNENGDGCSSNCKIEKGWTCPNAGRSYCQKIAK